MSKIAIIGYTAAGIKCAEDIKAARPGDEIIILTLGRERPYHRLRLDAYGAGQMNEDAFFCRPKQHLRDQGFAVCDKKIARVNLKKGVIVTDDREEITCDELVITDAEPARLTDIKGANKTGVFSLWGYPDAAALVKAIRLAETVVLRADSLLSVKMACAIRQRQLETILAVPGTALLPGILDAASSRILAEALSSIGIRVMLDSDVQEVLGDQDVKAVRLASGKVLGCQLLLAQGRPEMKIWKDLALSSGDRIVVDTHLRAADSRVYALDTVCDLGERTGLEDYADYADAVEAQGAAAARAILGDEGGLELPVMSDRISVGASVVEIVGCPAQGTEALSYEGLKASPPVYRRVCLREGKMTGAVFANAPGLVPLARDLITVQAEPGAVIYQILKGAAPEDGVSERHLPEPEVCMGAGAVSSAG